MSFLKKHIKNILFIFALTLLIIPQTRMPIQVFLNRGLAYFSPSLVSKESQEYIDNYAWRLQDLNGKHFNFKAAKGKVVLINFWATWCPPCVAELPSMQKLYAKYKEQVIFLFVTNEPANIVTPFLERKGFALPVYNTLTNYPDFFDVKTIPKTYLIDKKGAVVINKSGAANWDSDLVNNTIKQLLLN